MELASTGVHVSIVEPGAYKSQIRDKYVAQALTVDGEDDFVVDDETLNAISPTPIQAPYPDRRRTTT